MDEDARRPLVASAGWRASVVRRSCQAAGQGARGCNEAIQAAFRTPTEILKMIIEWRMPGGQFHLGVGTCQSVLIEPRPQLLRRERPLMLFHKDCRYA